MLKSFLLYFVRYIFLSKNRQRLLFLALVGLFISSFSLLVLQGTMGGLQNKLMMRSKAVLGSSTVFFNSGFRNKTFTDSVVKILNKKNIEFFKEYEIELLARNSGFVSPVVVHGIDLGIEKKHHLPKFLGNDLSGITLPLDLSRRLRVAPGDDLKLISPVHINSLLGEVPRLVTDSVENVINTDVPEVDILHIWCRLTLIQNLIRKKEINRIRIFKEIDSDKLQTDLLALSGGGIFLKTWEEQNQTLVFALRLESIAMVFLFVAMTMLVSICITSALMIFFDKIKSDLTSFWILGMSKKQINNSTFILLNILGLLTVLLGLFSAGLALFLLDRFGVDVMPAVFVDRKIPIHITPLAVLVSFSVPYVISIVFSYFSLSNFKNKISYLDHVRSVGV